MNETFVRPGFFKLFRGMSTVAKAGLAALPSSESLTRHSSGLAEFTRAISGKESLYVLDLGSTSPQNISHLTGLGHKIYSEDVLRASTDTAFRGVAEDGQPGVNVDRYLADNLCHPENKFDAVLCWDILDYLPEQLVKPVVYRIHAILKPGGVLLAFFQTRDAGPDAPYYRYHITGKETLELQSTRRFRLQRVFNNRQTENLFRSFSSLKFFLARDNIREMLLIR